MSANKGTKWLDEWCATEDQVARNAVFVAKTMHFPYDSLDEIEELIDLLSQKLIAYRSSGDADRLLNNSEQRDFDDVELVVAMHDQAVWPAVDKPEGLEQILALLALRESRRGHFGLAVRAADMAMHVRDRGAFGELSKVVRGRQKGGQASKRLEGVFGVVFRLVADNPGIKAKEVWGKIPKQPLCESFGDFDVYRGQTENGEDEILFQKNRKTQAVRKLLFSSFGRYFTDAKKEKKKHFAQ